VPRSYWIGADDTRLYNKAAASYQFGLMHEPDNAELKDGLCRARDGMDMDPEAGMAALMESLEGIGGAVGPELRAIMVDPVVMQVVANFTANPAAAAGAYTRPLFDST
jgi:hypothetical protein